MGRGLQPLIQHRAVLHHAFHKLRAMPPHVLVGRGPLASKLGPILIHRRMQIHGDPIEAKQDLKS